MATAPVTVNANLNFNPASINAAGKQVQSAFGNISLPTKAVNNFNNSLGRITGQASEFDKSINAATARVFAFGAAVSIINGLSTAFKALVSSTIEVEKRLTEIGSILGGTTEQLGQFKNAIFDVAKNTGQTFSTVADAASELARQGLSAEETVKRLNASLILTRVSGLDAEGSVNALTAAINGFTSAGLTAEQIVNKLIAVDTAFAVSAKDLAEAFSRAGSTAEDAGVSFDELLGLVTSVQQTTARGGAVIGNAFKSIFSRLSRGTVIEDLKALGVEIDSSQTGVQKLQALSDALSKISNPTQANAIKELAGGVYQINVVSAALKDLSSETSIFARASQTAGQASNEAFEKNAQLNQTLAAQINKLVQGLTELGSKIGELTIAPVIENLLTGANKLLDILNKVFDPEEGNKLIQGFFKGVGAFIAGPGLILVSAAFFKLFQVVAKFAKEGISDLFKIGSEQERIKNIEGGIVALLQQDANLRATLLSSSSTQAQKEQAVINAIKQQNALLTQQQALVNSIAAAAARAGVGGFTPSGGFTNRGGRRRFAAGYSGNVSPQEAAMEIAGASQHKEGYEAGKVNKGPIFDGRGSSFMGIWNDAETRKDFINARGYKSTLIIPPNGFAASGFVPNFYGKGRGKSNSSSRKPNINSIEDLTIGSLEAYRSSGITIGGTKYSADQVKEILDRRRRENLLKKEQRAEEIGSSTKPLPVDASRYGYLIPNLNFPTGKEEINGRLNKKWNGFNVFFKTSTSPTFAGPKINGEAEETNKDNELSSQLSESVMDKIINEGYSYASQLISPLIARPINKNGIKQRLGQGGNKGLFGAVQGAAGAAFEAAITEVLGINEASLKQNEGDFDAKQIPENLRELFQLPSGLKSADFKVSRSEGSKSSFIKKILNDRTDYYKGLLQGNSTKTKSTPKKASGFIPNFNSLNKGVPVNKIRAHFDDMGNPVAVTNTRDEPNGLKDAIGREKKGIGMAAGGFVPNFVFGAVGGSPQAAAAQAAQQVANVSSKFQKLAGIVGGLSAAFYVVQGFLPDFAYSLSLDSEALKKATKAKEDATKDLEEETKKAEKANESVIASLNEKIKKFDAEIALLEGKAQAMSDKTQTITNGLLSLGIFMPQIISGFNKAKTFITGMRLGGAALGGGAAATAGSVIAGAGTLTLSGIAAGGAVVIGTALVAAIATGLTAAGVGYLIQRPFLKAADEVSRIPLDLQKVRSEIISLEKIQIPNIEIDIKRYTEALSLVESTFANGYKTIKLTATGLRSEFEKINDKSGVSGFDSKVLRSEGIDRLASGAKDIVTQQTLKKTKDPFKQQKIISERESVKISDLKKAGERERAVAGQIIKAGQEDFLTGISKYLKVLPEDVNTAVLKAQADTAGKEGQIDPKKTEKTLIDNVFTTGVNSLDRVDSSGMLDTNPTYRDKLDSFDLISGIETALGQQGNQTQLYDAIKRFTDSSENLKNSTFSTDNQGNIESNQEANLKEFLNAEAALKPLLEKRAGSGEGGLEDLEETFKRYKDAVLEGVEAQTTSFIKQKEEEEKISLDSLVKQKDILDQFIDNFNSSFLQNAQLGANLFAEAFDSGSSGSSRINENIQYLEGANLGSGMASGETFIRRQQALVETTNQLESSGFFKTFKGAEEEASFRSQLASEQLGGVDNQILQKGLSYQSKNLQETIGDPKLKLNENAGARNAIASSTQAFAEVFKKLREEAVKVGDTSLTQDVNQRLSTLNNPNATVEQRVAAGNINLEGTNLSEAAQTEFQKSLISAAGAVQSTIDLIKGDSVARASDSLGKQIEGVAEKLTTLQEALKVTVDDVGLSTVIKEVTTSTEGLTPIVEAFKTKISELEKESSIRIELLKKYNTVEAGLLEIQQKYETTQNDLLGKVTSLVTNFQAASEKAKLFADNFPPPIPPQTNPPASTNPAPQSTNL